MRVRRVTGVGVGPYDLLELELPERGIVVVCGKNGAGKSSLIDAITGAAWGATRRGVTWHRGKSSTVMLEVDGLAITRTVSDRGAVSVHLSGGRGQAGKSFPSERAGQVEIDRLIGSREVWERTSLFTSEDASLFTAARDSERKALVERLIGLERVDLAADKARMRLAEATTRQTALQRDIDRLRPIVEMCRRRADDAVEALDLEFDDAYAFFRKRRTQLEADDAEGMVSEVEASVSDLRTVARHVGGFQDEARRVEELSKRGICQGCRRPYKHVDATDAIGEIFARAREAIGEGESIREIAERVETKVSDAEARLRAVRDVASTRKQRAALAQAALLEAERRAVRVADAESKVEKARAELLGYESDLEKRLAEFAEADLDVKLAKAIADVLGPRGVRSSLLADAFGALEAAANRYIGRLLDGARISISGTTEQKSGAVVNKTSIDVSGGPGPHGLKGFSSGQRRRVDLAILFGLAELAEAGRESDGTIFFDEAFDALDLEGVEITTEILGEIAERRTVVVITHSEALRERLRPRAVEVLHVEGGRIESARAVQGEDSDGTDRDEGARGQVREARTEVRTAEEGSAVAHDRDPSVGRRRRTKRSPGPSASRSP